MNASQAGRTQLEWFSIFGVLVLVGLTYSPVILNAFNGDDFVHLKWLHEAVSQPELIWRNFHSSWLDLTTAKFYRPLISIFMLADYIVWHNNGIGFHLTNLFCHLANTLLLWLCLKNIIGRQSPNQSISHHIWCLSSATLFGLYPLHTEAVSWITGRVDVIVTLFFLTAFYCYLRWRQANQYWWLFLGGLAFSASLLCKEMAVVFPLMVFAYELIFGYKENHKLGHTLKDAFQFTWIFWLLLFAYFLLRFCALGTLIGGYDNTNLSIPDWHLFVYLWKQSLHMLIVPFNQHLLSDGQVITYLWFALLMLSLVMGLKRLFLGKDGAIFSFLCVWLILSLLPVYKVFNIATDLQGARLAYLATVPLCMLICFGLANGAAIENKISYWHTIALTILVSIAGAGLLVNNSAWTKAELTSQAILQQLNMISKTNAANTVVYIVDLPDHINGAYVCRNALDGMTKYPQISKDIKECFDLSSRDDRFPFGYALHSMTNASPESPAAQFYTWLHDQMKLEQFHLPDKASESADKTWAEGNIESDISLYMTGKPCINTDFLVVDCDLHQPGTRFRSCGSHTQKYGPLHPYFIYKTDLHNEESRISPQETCKPGQFLFPLHSKVYWALAGKCTEFKLSFSPPYTGPSPIKVAAVVPANKIMPILSFKGNPNQYVVGYIELDQLHSSCHLNYDATKMSEAKGVIIEFTRPNQTFAVANDPRLGGPGWLDSPYKRLAGLSGSAILTKADFPEAGIYGLRLRAVGKDNIYVGAAGDHIIVTVR